jgi:hypothetical protein
MIRNILPAVAAGSALLLSLIGAPGQSMAAGDDLTRSNPITFTLTTFLTKPAGRLEVRSKA